VEELDVIEGSSFEMQYGSGDVSQFLIYLLKERYRLETFCQYTDASMARVQDMVIFEEMREAVCHFDFVRMETVIMDIVLLICSVQANVKPKLYEFCVRRRNQSTVLYRVDAGLAQVGAPLSIFYPQLFHWTKARNTTQKFDPHDHHANIYGIKPFKDPGSQIILKKPKKNRGKRKAGEEEPEPEEYDQASPTERRDG